MSVQAVRGRIGAGRAVSGVRRNVSRKLEQLPHEINGETKPKIKAEGSCGGIVSWSLNTNPAAQREKVKAEGSCGGMISWSNNRTPMQSQREGVKAEGSCGGMVSWSMNQIAAGQLLN